MGPQKSKLILKTEGNVLTGRSEAPMGVVPIQEGKVNGDEFEFVIHAKSPMGPLRIAMKGKVEGDIISGEAKAPIFASTAVNGKRI
jgi:hypothetical protein